jgi:hypothetical protein
MAAELLIAKAAGIRIATELSARFHEVRPFGEGGPPLGQLLNRNLAAALIPEDRSNGGEHPRLWQVWVVEDNENTLGPDHVRRLDGAEAFKNENAATGWKLYLVGESDRPGTGTSWQLGAALAVEAAKNPAGVGTGKDAPVLRLAREWIATGSVREGQVVGVGLGNKHELHLDPLRTWLVPSTNEAEAREALRGKPFACVPTVAKAWRWVTGEGTAESPAEPWPDSVPVMHSLSSKVMRPVIGSVLLCRPRRLILWQSEDEVSKKAAERISEVVRRLKETGHLPEGVPEIAEPRLVPSRNLAAAERAIREGLASTPQEEDGVTFFNVTNGNFIMKLAAHNEALPINRPSTARVWLLYKDADREEFTAVRYNGSLPETFLLQPRADFPDAAMRERLKAFLETKVEGLEDVESMLKSLL